MISSRRLAREWALRILYQCDVLIPVTRDITRELIAFADPDFGITPDTVIRVSRQVGAALYAARDVLERGIFQLEIPSSDQARLRQILDEATIQFDQIPKPPTLNNLFKFLRVLAKDIRAAERLSLASEVEAVYASTFERLRKEFVQRGSRTASGSASEEIILEELTRRLAADVASLKPQEIAAIVEQTRTVLALAPLWQESMLIEAFRGIAPESLRRKKPGQELKKILAGIPVMLTPTLDTATLLPNGVSTEQNDIGAVRTITQARPDLINLLEMVLWERGFDFVRECAVACDGMPAVEARALVLAKQEEFNQAQIAYWKKVSAMVEKQLSDWLQTASFTQTIARGTQEKQSEVDTAIAELTEGWSMERQAIVDRNILRLAGYEMLFLPDIPSSASINEAVELAKKYSTGESGRFVNGVLGALALKVGAKNPVKSKSAAQEEVADIEEIPESEETETNE